MEVITDFHVTASFVIFCSVVVFLVLFFCFVSLKKQTKYMNKEIERLHNEIYYLKKEIEYMRAGRWRPALLFCEIGA